MIEVMQLSPITKSAVSLIASFVRGDGFEGGDMVVNEFGDTINDLLELVSDDYALFNGFALLVNSTANGQVTNLQHIPFEYCRLGLVDQRGRAKTIAVSNNWESSNSDVLPINTENIRRFSLWSEKAAAQQALNGRATVLYVTSAKYSYPLASIDAIIESAQTDNELQVFELGNVSNGFLSGTLFKIPASGNDKDDQAIKDELEGFKGARNANSMFAVRVDEDFQGDVIEQIPANNNDSLFIQTTLNVRNRICENYGIPPALLGVLPEGSVFTQDQIADNYTYMNLRTKDTRNMIERQFKKLGLDVGSIVPNQFESSQMLNNANNKGQTLDSTE
jgi:hypothetical protein